MKQSENVGVSVLGVIGLSLLTVGSGCGTEANDNDDFATAEQHAVGDFLPNLRVDPALLEEARDAFVSVEGIEDGVGPIFNESACGTCHSDGATGGAGEQIERRFGRFVRATSDRDRSGGGREVFDPLADKGGSLRQLFTVGNFDNPNLPAASQGLCDPSNPTLCCVPLEVEPTEATVKNVGRRTTPLFGLGLVDAMPDSFFEGLAAAQPSAIRGVVNRVSVVIPNPGDRTQRLNSTRVGRFGWKAGVPSLLQFSADAYVNEMAITTQSCFRGQSLNAFAIESAPNGVPVADGCDDLAERQTGPNPGGLTATQWAQADDVVGVCTDNRTEIQDDVFLFAVFMTALAPPPRDFSDRNAIDRGEPLFSSTGCAGCHVRTTFTTPRNPAPVDIGNGEETITVPGNFRFNPYSDFLVHDMGSLGDQIGNAGDSRQTTRRMRTQPLWGNRFQTQFLHDGRCSDIRCAIQAHDGQGAAARDAFNRLRGEQQRNLIQFVRAL